MIPTAPQIGFDRFIQLDWVAAALKVRAGMASLDELNELLDAAGLGKEAKAKTRTKLNALALEPRADLADFIDRGVQIFKGAEDAGKLAAFAWGAAIANYHYFGKVAEFTGRLTSIQGDCAVSEIHRRISEVYGDREVIAGKKLEERRDGCVAGRSCSPIPTEGHLAGNATVLGGHLSVRARSASRLFIIEQPDVGS